MISVKEVIRKCRVNLLRDVDADDFKWSDKRLLEAFNNAVQKALRIRPILRWQTSRKYLNPKKFIVTDLTYVDGNGVTQDTTLPIPEQYEEALVYGTASDVYINLDADQVLSQQGQNFDGKFLQLMSM